MKEYKKSLNETDWVFWFGFIGITIAYLLALYAYYYYKTTNREEPILSKIYASTVSLI